ncbi:MAG: choice-of-anchor D domain-containing protein [Acidobacteria bacterium]|nr:choice-of-anchor D domain-containing protein [Acidobacteriota bacterium]
MLTLNNPVGIFDYIRQNINTTSAGQVVIISNSGTSGLSITGVSVTGLHPTNFLLSANTCVGATLAPGATCNVTVAFRPSATGVRSGRLTVTDNADGSQHLVPLTGIGLNPSVPNRNVGPVDPRVGFPLWQQDDQGTRLGLCLDTTNTLCLSQPAFTF